MLGSLPQRRMAAAALTLLLLGGPLLAGCGARGAETATPPLPEPTERPAIRQPEPPPPPAEPVAQTEPSTPARPDPALPGALAVMVENSVWSLPQIGLEQADLVYELEAEFGITRFLAFFYQEAVARIGPVRSARMGFYDIVAAYGTPYAHIGGSFDALDQLRNRDRLLLDLDELYSCDSCFWRDRRRSAPHNAYTSTDLLLKRALAVGWKMSPLHRFAEGAPVEGGSPVKAIAFHWGPKSQQVSWTWDGSRYLRSQSGEPHLMENGAHIGAENLVLLFVKYVWDANAPPEGLNRISIVGRGTGYLYRDGQAYPIRWEKPAPEEHYRLTFADGEPVRLAMGQTWVEVLKSEAHVERGLPPRE